MQEEHSVTGRKMYILTFFFYMINYTERCKMNASIQFCFTCAFNVLLITEYAKFHEYFDIKSDT